MQCHAATHIAPFSPSRATPRSPFLLLSVAFSAAFSAATSNFLLISLYRTYCFFHLRFRQSPCTLFEIRPSTCISLFYARKVLKVSLFLTYVSFLAKPYIELSSFLPRFMYDLCLVLAHLLWKPQFKCNTIQFYHIELNANKDQYKYINEQNIHNIMYMQHTCTCININTNEHIVCHFKFCFVISI